jgi:hypothetical protein
VIAEDSLRTIPRAPYPRALIALVAATLAVLLDPIFRFADYRPLWSFLPVAGLLKFTVALKGEMGSIGGNLCPKNKDESNQNEGIEERYSAGCG